MMGFVIMISYGAVGLTSKDKEGKWDKCESGKWAYVGVWTFTVFVYGFLLLGLVLPYFGLPRWLTLGYEIGGFMPTSLEELGEVYGEDVPLAITVYHACRQMGRSLMQGKDFREVAVFSFFGLIAIFVVLLPGILVFFMPQLLRSIFPPECQIPNVGW